MSKDILGYLGISLENTSGAISMTMKGRDSMSIFILSPVSFAFSLPLIYMSEKCAE